MDIPTEPRYYRVQVTNEDGTSWELPYRYTESWLAEEAANAYGGVLIGYY